jgi:hypothetical protein
MSLLLFHRAIELSCATDDPGLDAKRDLSTRVAESVEAAAKPAPFYLQSIPQAQLPIKVIRTLHGGRICLAKVGF